ncbi:FAD-dependent monooxygenase [Gordonia hankookensis]|uniref:FAD-dependent monooxygenase n=1 Tax=Gordonia hankookensis TaxID=589403 RepID=A0ABR7WK50_9ACTN|nr:FAD-dependent monooxygenase [Gordonia hankookensis]MBD1322169.1 FAD-dependent monooxygenase [Gordonia hankookensis]
MTSTEAVDVLIVGAGPTGTTLAIDLVRRGHSVRIIDRAPGGFEGSRAKGIQPRTLEVFADLGVIDEIEAGGSTYPPMGIHLGPLTIPKRMVTVEDPSTEVPYPSTWLIPQHSTVAALHARLGTLGTTVAYRTELIDLDQNDESVTATIVDADGTTETCARFVVGADGGGSSVRKSQAIPFEGTTDDADRMIILDAVTHGLRRDRWHIWPALGGRFTGACPLPNSEQFQWMIRIRDDDIVDLADDALTDLIRTRTRNGRMQLGAISWKSVFRPNIRLAQRYRDRRVFVAGDAAHVHTPAGAQGLNTGVQDAYNLGWKLSQVLAGAPERLLDTYEAERQPIAAHVLGLSTKNYDKLTKLDPSALKRGDDERQLSITYRGGPLAPVDAESTRTLQVGDRAPDARLLKADGGGPMRLFELYAGPHFTVVGHGPTAAAHLSHVTWPSVGARLRTVAVNSAQAELDASTVVLADIAGDFATTYGITSDTMFLIRPDGYIGAIAHDLDAMLAAVSGLTPG